jgi:hypothetical protein
VISGSCGAPMVLNSWARGSSGPSSVRSGGRGGAESATTVASDTIKTSVGRALDMVAKSEEAEASG